MEPRQQATEFFFAEYGRHSNDALKDPPRRGEIAFQNIYFLNFADGAPRVFAYIMPDEEQAMRDHGLI